MATFNLKINGKIRRVDLDPATPMLWVLRDHLDLQGTKYGCGIAQCGACTVHLDGTAVRSCQLPVSAVGKQAITTIEGLSAKGDHPSRAGISRAWRRRATKNTAVGLLLISAITHTRPTWSIW